MKKVTSLLLVLAIGASMLACGNKNSGEKKSTNEADGKDYVCVYNEVEIPMDAEAAPIIQKLGSDYKYFESASCAFEGLLDKSYSYGSAVEIGTYPGEKGEKDYISYVYLKDNTVATKEGVKVGDSVETMKDKYGAGTEDAGTYVYKGANMTLKFVVINDVIDEIDYCSNVPK